MARQRMARTEGTGETMKRIVTHLSLLAATAILLPLAALVAVGGPAGLADGLGEVAAAGYLSPTRNLVPIVGIGWVLGLLGIGLGYPGQPHVVNRFMALQEGEAPLRRASSTCFSMISSCESQKTAPTSNSPSAPWRRALTRSTTFSTNSS